MSYPLEILVVRGLRCPVSLIISGRLLVSVEV